LISKSNPASQLTPIAVQFGSGAFGNTDFSAVAHDQSLLNLTALAGLMPASASRHRWAYSHLLL
jgi:hypothetical protein